MQVTLLFFTEEGKPIDSKISEMEKRAIKIHAQKIRPFIDGELFIKCYKISTRQYNISLFDNQLEIGEKTGDRYKETTLGVINDTTKKFRAKLPKTKKRKKVKFFETA
jgi:hypothetical protein